jgi:hypothetical protein
VTWSMPKAPVWTAQNQITSISHQYGYPELCIAAAQDENIFSCFKTFHDYRHVLEHVKPEQGQAYYDFVKENYGESLDSLEACLVNDKQGKPLLHEYQFGNWSPTTLRYFKVSLDIQHCFGETKEMNVLEIGGGYGGQCMVHDNLLGFKSWTIVDLPEVTKLQKRYLSDIKSDFNATSCYNVEDNNNYDLVISNYAFSELTRKYQDKYIDAFMSNEEKIYMTVNFIPQTDQRFRTMYRKEELLNRLNLSEFEEIPNTHPENVIVMRGNQKELPNTKDDSQ